MPEPKPVVFVTRKLPEAVEARLLADYRPILNPDDRPYGPEELLEKAREADAILTCGTEKWPASLIERLPERVRIIATFSVGYEHIDIEACRRRGIVVTNTPEVLTEATADIALLCLLGAARRAYEAQRDLRAGRWTRWGATQYLGLGLQDRVLGIVGMGRIGRAVARRARGFGLRIHYHNRRRLPPELEAGATYHETLDAMLPHCQFLSVNCPGSPENVNLLDARRIALLPKGAVVVNTARGNIIEEKALLAAVKSGHLFAVGLDVYQNEPNVDPEWFGIDNAFLLPHIGSATIETRNAMGFCCLDNLDAFFAGKPVPNPVT
ncbi:Glycerate dehydrogenase [bacterium HR40]|jgi:lactate dehydrogenase-like 2-hydroxyacid dehydrogenase|nr:Glycerate dehydrogenase [bacterium HR40]